MNAMAARARALIPGIAVCLTAAAAASFLSDHYGAPVMLFALLIGIALNHFGESQAASPGIQFSGRTVLRVGVALLGVRVTLSEIAALGWEPFALIVVSVAVTIALSVIAARAMGFNPLFGLLSGGATAICGASAALAIAAALPSHPLKERATAFTIVGVSLLSTLTMIAYPIVASALHLPSADVGVFLGATIHDVAQVVGAGYSVSHEVGDTATVVKLTRVALLLPVILIAALATRSPEGAGEKRPPLLPWFAIAFFALLVVNSTGIVPAAIGAACSEVSRWCLVTAIAALGMKTSIRDIAAAGVRPIVLMVAETVLLAAIVLAALVWLI